jgi:hypothetical protein
MLHPSFELSAAPIVHGIVFTLDDLSCVHVLEQAANTAAASLDTECWTDHLWRSSFWKQHCHL